jgi:mutator protein MutT
MSRREQKKDGKLRQVAALQSPQRVQGLAASAATRVAIAVVEHDGQFLIGQRPPGVPLAGLWEFPGGKIHPGETAQRAAERECLEETGVQVTADGVYFVNEHEYPHGRLELHFIACRVPNPPSNARPPFRWVAREELSRYEFPAANAELLKRLT